MEILPHLQRRGREIADEIVAIRRDLHAHPELAFEETRTAGKVIDFLEAEGILYESGVAITGVVAMIEGNPDGPVIALRGDMDALPIQEANDVDYKSNNSGKMHACGHDVHTSSLLGVARLLNEIKDHLPGRIKLIFQPSEEKIPGGASVMIKEGVLQNPDVQAITGQHVDTKIPVGKIGIKSGRYMASADEIHMTIKGVGGHAAHPYECKDPIVAMAQMITALQTVVSRSADPRVPSVLSFGDVRAFGATNIIPEEVKLMGTFRTYDEDWRFRAHDQIRSIAHGIIEGLGLSLDLEIKVGYPVLHNDEELTATTEQAIREFMGDENVINLDLWPAAEDFAYYTHEVPGCFYRLGIRNEERGIIHGLHTPRFNIDESALQHSTALMAWVAVRQLHAKAKEQEPIALPA